MRLTCRQHTRTPAETYLRYDSCAIKCFKNHMQLLLHSKDIKVLKHVLSYIMGAVLFNGYSQANKKVIINN